MTKLHNGFILYLTKTKEKEMRSTEYNGAMNFEKYNQARVWFEEAVDEMTFQTTFSDQDIARYNNLANYLEKNGFVKMGRHIKSLLND